MPLQASLANPDTQDEAAKRTELAQSAHAVKESVAHSRHHNHNQRKDAVWALRQAAVRTPAAVLANLSDVVSALAERVGDIEDAVRQATVSAWETLCAAASPAQFAPFWPLVAVYLRSGLSKLQPSLRHDALACLVVIVRAYPTVVSVHVPKLLGAVLRVMSRIEQRLVVRSLAGSFLPPTLMPKKNKNKKG